MKVSQFLKKHNIKSCPIDVQFNEDNTVKCIKNMSSYTHFTKWSAEKLADKQSFRGGNLLAIDTHDDPIFDIDNKIFKYLYPDGCEKIKKSPHYKSRNKRLPHYFVKLNYSNNKMRESKNCRSFSGENVTILDILKGQWAWCLPNEKIINGDNEIVTIEESDFDNSIVDKYNTCVRLLVDFFITKGSCDYKKWHKIGCVLYNEFGENLGLEMFLEFSRMAPKYKNDDDVKDQFSLYCKNVTDESKKIKLPSLECMARDTKPYQYKRMDGHNKRTELQENKAHSDEINKDEFISILNKGQAELADYYYNQFKDDVIVINEDLLYIYDPKTTIWEDNNKTGMMVSLGKMVQSKLKSKLNDYDRDSDIQFIEKKLNTYTRANYLSDVVKYLIKYFKDPEKGKLLNHNRYLISFKNGVYDLKLNEFRERIKYDYITFTLQYDYTEKVNKKATTKIQTIMKQICNDSKIDFKFMCNWFGYCITGITKEQKFLFNLGHTASNGKSTLAEIFDRCFKEYSIKLDRQTFKKGYSKAHKHIIGIKFKRFIYVEELDRSSLNVELIKDIVSGDTIKNEIMYGTDESIDIYCKLNIISNFDPIFDADEGIKRRGLCMVHTNIFVDEKDYIKGKKGIYLLDRDIKKLFDNDEYKLAFIKILLPYAHNYIKSGIDVPSHIRDGFKDMVAENDEMKCFLDNNYLLTGNDEDRVQKDEFTEYYNIIMKSKIPKKFPFLLSDLKRKGIKYDRIKRKNNIKGVILGIKLKEEDKSTSAK